MSDASFKDAFGVVPAAHASAHGRVNLIGDHTDYNDGLVMPCLLSQKTDVQLALRDDDLIRGISNSFDPAQTYVNDARDGSWLDFVKGAIRLLQPKAPCLRGVDVMVTSSVPAGAGVSSSAALEIALLRSLCAALSVSDLDPVAMAHIAQRIEHEFVGTKCGIMDQMVSSAAEPGLAMMLDCQSLAFTLVPLFEDAAFVVMHSGSSRKLSDGLYNTRLQECRSVSERLGVHSLRHATEQMLGQLADPVMCARARHVVQENARVLAAHECLGKKDSRGFGELMTQSHASLRDDYQVSSIELDTLVEAFLACGALGARLTGAGFGGCVVALCLKSDVQDIELNIQSMCKQAYLVDVLNA